MEMLKMEFADAKLFKAYLKAVHTLVDELQLTVGPDGIMCRVMDASRVAMVELVMPKECFDEYVYSETEPRKVTLNLDNLFSTKRNVPFKNIYPDNHVIFLFTGAPLMNEMQVTLKGQLERNWTLPLLENTADDNPTPQITFKARAKIVLASLLKILKDVEDYGHLKMSIDNERVRFQQKGDEQDFDVELKLGSDSLLDVEANHPSCSNYSPSYLTEFVKALTPLCDIVTIQLADDMPMQLTPTLAHPDASMTYWLAPTITTD